MADSNKNLGSLSNAQIGGIGMGATIGGSLLSAGGNIASGFNNAAMFNYQSALARLQAGVAGQNAEFAIQTGEQQAVKTGLAQAQRFGQIRVAQGASGTDVNSGSNKQVQDSQRMLDQMDLTQIRSNAARTAYGYKIEGAMDTAQAGLYDSAASNAITAGGIGAASSILGGASSVSSEWLQGQRVGLFNSSSGGSNPGFSIGGA
jgi:hypothetical protein